MKKFRMLFPLFFIAAITLFPITARADATAHAIWGVGVQLGFAEVGANQGVSPNTLTLSLGYAREMAKQSGCIPFAELERLTVDMNRTNNSRTLYSRITNLRQSLPTIIQKNCRCAGGSNVAWALWGAGVQIGYSEMASYLGILASQVAQSLVYARDLASQTHCIDIRRIQELINAMRGTNDSRTVYQSITSYRQGQMFVEVQRNCSCGGAGGCGDLTGRWSNTIPGGSSIWDIRRSSGGGYQAVESGMGSARSTSVTFSGKRLRINWSTGGVEGYYEWLLDANCQQSVSGTVVWTRGATGSRTSALKRQQ